MSSKKELLDNLDNLIKEHGNKNPKLLHDLQMHRDAVANALNKKDLKDMALRIANVAKLLIDFWPDS